MSATLTEIHKQLADLNQIAFALTGRGDELRARLTGSSTAAEPTPERGPTQGLLDAANREAADLQHRLLELTRIFDCLEEAVGYAPAAQKQANVEPLRPSGRRYVPGEFVPIVDVLRNVDADIAAELARDPGEFAR
jgi:hypothetical protein